jgi:hypothetical protein
VVGELKGWADGRLGDDIIPAMRTEPKDSEATVGFIKGADGRKQRQIYIADDAHDTSLAIRLYEKCRILHQRHQPYDE